jgi:hypothetical protein
MITVPRTEQREHSLPGQLVKRADGIDPPAIEKDPSSLVASEFPVRQGNLHGASRKGRGIDPRQSIAAAFQFLPHDPAAGLLDNRVPPGSKLFQQGGLAAAGTPRQQDEAFAHG